MAKKDAQQFVERMLLGAEYERSELLAIAQRFRIGDERPEDRDELLTAALQISGFIIGLQREFSVRA